MNGQGNSGEKQEDIRFTEPQKTIAGRVIPLVEAFQRGVDKARGKALGEPKLSSCLPSWCHSIAERFAKTIFKSTIALDPKGQFDARNFGRIVGVLLRGLVFIYKEAEPLLRKEGLWEMDKEREEKIEKAMGTELVFPIVSEKVGRPVTNEDELTSVLEGEAGKRVGNLLEMVEKPLLHILGQSVRQQHQFLRGIPEGFISLLNSGGTFTGDRGRTNMYILLLMCWPEIAEMQKADRPKSRKHLLEWLEKIEGTAKEPVQLVVDEKTFYDLCDDIGLVMKQPGPPLKRG